MEFTIQKPNIAWRQGGVWVPLVPENVEGIAIHHMAHPSADIPIINKWHLDRWASEPGFGYNYWVSLKGEIFEGRGKYRGAHAGGQNSKLIGIGFQGNYEPQAGIAHQDKMPDAQYNAGVWLIAWLKKQYPRIRVVHGHKNWTATACPGRFFPLVEMVGGKYRGQAAPVDQLAEAIKVLQANGIMNSPDYWIQNARPGKQANGEYVGLLIQNMAKKLRG